MHLKNATQHDCTLISFGVVVSGKSFPGAAIVLSFSEKNWQNGVKFELPPRGTGEPSLLCLPASLQPTHNTALLLEVVDGFEENLIF